MSMLDGILSQAAGNSTVAGLAAKVGLTPQQVEIALAALGSAHKQPGDTVTQAAQQTACHRTSSARSSVISAAKERLARLPR